MGVVEWNFPPKMINNTLVNLTYVLYELRELILLTIFFYLIDTTTQINHLSWYCSVDLRTQSVIILVSSSIISNINFGKIVCFIKKQKINQINIGFEICIPILVESQQHKNQAELVNFQKFRQIIFFDTQSTKSSKHFALNIFSK